MGRTPSNAPLPHRLRAGESIPGVLDATTRGQGASFNNLLDADAAWGAIQGLADPAVAIVKHTIPCGLASRDDLTAAFDEALNGDPVSAFGGIVALNRPIDGETASQMSEIFFEVVIAPGFDDVAVETLGKKKSLRLLLMPPESSSHAPATDWDMRPIKGGFLVQTADVEPADPSSWRVVTSREARRPGVS